jgi:peptidoglycan/LPS O-acetylase OafA/YrhL
MCGWISNPIAMRCSAKALPDLRAMADCATLARHGRRTELDGLRGILVPGVLGVHAPFAGLSGGFISIDAFFTLSGFLIAGILIDEAKDGRFSYVQFYLRRVRRVIPALVPMMIFVLAIGLWVMTPLEYVGAAKTTLGILFLVPNFVMPSRVGYFSNDAHLNPLIHSWSLGIEEQFYLVFPLIMMAAFRSRRFSPLAVMTIISIISFGIAAAGINGFGGDSYYMPYARSWELSVGVIAAIAFRSPRLWRPAQGIKETLAALSIVALLLVTHFYGEAQSQPGFYNLVPVLATVLIVLFCDQSTLAGRFLSFRPFVWLGLISYSVYIWHQPLYALMHLTTFTPVPRSGRIAATIISLLVAWASWYWVEKPYRDRMRTSTRTLLTVVGFSWLLIGAASGVILANKGWADRRLPSGGTAASINDAEKFNAGFDSVCNGFTLDARCRSRVDPQIMVWGDSHAMDSVLGVDAANPGKGVIQMVMPACPPIPGFARLDAPGSTLVPERGACLRFQQQVMAWLPQQKSIQTVVIVSGLLTEELHQQGSADQANRDETAPAIAALIKTAQAIRAMGKVPVFIAPLPYGPVETAICARRRSLWGSSPDRCAFPLAPWQSKNRVALAGIEQMARRMTVIRPWQALCQKGQCKVARDGTILYWDFRHLTEQGSIWLAKRQDWGKVIQSAH